MAATQTHKRISKHDLKTDGFTTAVFSAKEWAEGNMRTVVLVVGTIVALVAGTWGFTSYRANQEEAAQALYGEAGVEMRSSNPTAAIALLRKLLDEHGGAGLAGAGCLQLAHLQFQERLIDDARISYQRYVDEYGDDPYLSAAAHAGLGAIEEQTGFPENALDHYARAVDANPTGFQAPEYLRRLVRASIACGNTQRALDAYNTLKTDFADNPDNLVLARQMLIEHKIIDPNDS